jgi:hypothetical protein
MTITSYLSPTQQAVLRSVGLFRQLTTSQIRRLHYSGTYNGQRVRVRRHLARLTKLGYLKRMWGAYGNALEYVYQVPSVTARTPEPHTLDIAEVYIRLAERAGIAREQLTTGNPGEIYAGPGENYADSAENYANQLTQDGVSCLVVFDPEPWCHTRVGHVQLKPDAYIEVGGTAYFAEIDRGVEHDAQLTAKMRRYVAAIDSGYWPQDRAFPLVVWTVPDAARRRYVENVINKLGERELFRCVVFDEAVKFMST